MARRVVYLSGRIGGLTYEEASASRNEAARLLHAAGWDTLDPMRGYEILSTLDEKPIKDDDTKRLLGVTDQAILQRDEDDVRRSDVILIFSGDTPTWGTAFEWQMAYTLKKPIVVIASKDAVSRGHPWCRSMASYFAETVEEAVQFITEWLDRGYSLGNEKECPRCKHEYIDPEAEQDQLTCDAEANPKCECFCWEVERCRT